MAPALRKESLADDEAKGSELDANKLKKSILRAASSSDKMQVCFTNIFGNFEKKFKKIKYCFFL